MPPRAGMSTECVSLSSFAGSSSVPIFFAGIPAAPSPRRELRASQLRADAEQPTQRWVFSFPSTFYIKNSVLQLFSMCTFPSLCTCIQNSEKFHIHIPRQENLNPAASVSVMQNERICILLLIFARSVLVTEPTHTY